jgi:SpoIID/LytB domain protein
MKPNWRRILLLLLTVPRAHAAHIPPRVDVDPGAHPERIRVRVAEGLEQVLVRGMDLRIYQSSTVGRTHNPALAGEKLALATDRRTEWELRCDAGRVRALARDGRRLDLAEPATFESPTGFLQLQDRPFREAIHVYSSARANGDGTCDVINELDVEKYLEGLVNREFNSSWSREAIAAQVIAARTYAYYQIRQADLSGARFDLDGSVKDQVYDGSDREDYRASREVQRTRGIILTPDREGDDPRPLKAFYHSTCGGHTALPQRVWGARIAGFKHSVSCPYCASSPRLNWEIDLTPRDLSEAILKGARTDRDAARWPAGVREAVRGGALLDLRTRGVSPEDGRVREVVTSWSAGAGRGAVELVLPATRLRDWVGSTLLRSTAFEATPHRVGLERRWRFAGRGYGHGVGMCQWGAKVMAEQGQDYSAILSHYYPDAYIRKLW